MPLPFSLTIFGKTAVKYYQADWPTDASDHKKENKQVSEQSERQRRGKTWEEQILSVE